MISFPRLHYLFMSLGEEGPELILRKNIIAVQQAAQENNINEMFSQQESESSLINTCSQPRQEISIAPDATSELLSDIAAFLATRSSPIAAVDAPLFPGSARNPQPEQSVQHKGNEPQPISIAIAYVAIDEIHKNLIERDLRTLARQRWNIEWNAYDINAPLEWVTDVDDPLNACNLLLLLVSPEFVNSEFCYDLPVSQAVERHKVGAFWVSPILLRPCLWEDTPFGQNQIAGRGLPVLPQNLLPVTEWRPREDAAFLNIVTGIKRALEYLKGRI